MRRVPTILITTTALLLALVTGPIGPVGPAAAQTSLPTQPFTLTNGTLTVPNPVDHPFYNGLTAVFTAIELRVANGRVAGGESDFPVSGPGATGTENLSVSGTYDSTSGAVSGAFTFSQHLDWVNHPTLKTWDSTWNGSVSGTVTAQGAPLTFDGTLDLQCVYLIDAPCNGGGGTPLAIPVTFTVPTTPPVTVPNAEARWYVTGVSGPVYWSNAEQEDLEPAQRTWTKLGPGERAFLPEGVTVRTGRGGTVKLKHRGTAHIRLGPSTMYTVYLEGAPPTWAEWWEKQKGLYQRLYEGIAHIYSPHVEMSVGPVAPGSKLYEYYYDANGRVRAHPKRDAATRFVMKTVAAGATKVIAKKSTVLVEHVTGTSVTLRPGQSVTSTSEGLGPVRK